NPVVGLELVAERTGGHLHIANEHGEGPVGETTLEEMLGLAIDDPVDVVRHCFQADFVSHAALTHAPAADDHEEAREGLAAGLLNLAPEAAELLEQPLLSHERG